MPHGGATGGRSGPSDSPSLRDRGGGGSGGGPNTSSPQSNPSGMGGLTMPVSGVSPNDITDTFGASRGGGSRSHKGVDIFANTGTPVVAAASGTITVAGASGGLGGNRVWIRDSRGLHHYYAHLDSVTASVGQEVSAGDQIGTVGQTGNAQSTPPHLHYSINSRQGAETGEINPYEALSGAEGADLSPEQQLGESPSVSASEDTGGIPGLSGGTGTSTGSGSSPPRTEEEIAAHIRSNYGHLAWAIDHDEIGPILREAARDQWSAGRLKGAIVDTNWWGDTAESQRQWQALEGEDPASAQRQVESRTETLAQRLGELGVPVQQDDVTDMARDSLRFGWNEAETNSAVSSYISTFSRRQIMEREGQLSAQVDSIRQMARQEFLTPITSHQAFQHALGVVDGTTSEDSVRSSMFESAASRFPDFADRIRAGETPRQVFDPYIGMAAETLEMDPGQVDPVDDPRFAPMTEFVDDDGNRRAMTLAEWGRHVRGLPEYELTERANQQAAQMASTLTGIFNKKVI